MEEIVFRNIAYSFFPFGINALTEKEKYINSYEFMNLLKSISYFEKKNLLTLKDKINNSKRIRLIDKTSFEHLDRSYYFISNYEFNNTIYPIYIYISFIIPHFTILYNSKDKFILKNEVNLISSIIKTHTGFNEFPNNLLEKKISNISFQDIKENEFNFFNAFFSDSIKI